MTPAPPPPPTDDNVDVNDVLNEGISENEGLDPESLDADFEQELEDLFSDDLEEDAAAAEESSEADDEPMVLDEVVAEADDDMLVLDDVAEDVGEDIMVLDDMVEGEGEDVVLLADAVEEAPAAGGDAVDIEALVDDIAEENAPEPEPEPVSDEDALVLDDLLDDDGDGGDEDIADLDALLEEGDEVSVEADAEDIMVLEDVVADVPVADGVVEDILLEDVAEVAEEPAAEVGEIVLEDVVAEDAAAEEISMEPDDMMDAALAEESAPDIPVDEAVAADEIDLLMDEPEVEALVGDVLETAAVEDSPVLEGVDDSDISDLAGLDKLDENDDIEDMDSLLDNVEVDVSDIVEDETEDLDVSDMDVDTGLTDMLVAEVMPQDVGVDVSDEVDVDQLLADVRTEASASVVAELQGKVALLEARVEDLEKRLRNEIAQLVPAEAARIIREEIAVLARELDD